MTRTKSFSARNPGEDEPLQFDISGRVWPCVSFVPADVLLDFMASSDPEHPTQAVEALRLFIRQSIILKLWVSFGHYFLSALNLLLLSRIS